MLQQTTVQARSRPISRASWRAGPTCAALAAAPLDDVLKAWAGLGYYARARNLHACAQAVVERHGGRFPDSEEALARAAGHRRLYGGGDRRDRLRPARRSPVDGNIERVVARLFAVEEPLPAAKAAIQRLAATLTPHERPGDFAQAMMDLGATICTPKKPGLRAVPLAASRAGARRAAIAETFPRKAPKAEGTLRRGAAFVAPCARTAACWCARGRRKDCSAA